VNVKVEPRAHLALDMNPAAVEFDELPAQGEP